MAKEIIMPKNGMDMKEGVLIRWLVNVGDKVDKDDPIMEIETDKVTMESESPATGTVLALYYGEGTTIPVLKIIGYIGEAGEEVPALPPDMEAAPAPAAAPEPAAAPADMAAPEPAAAPPDMEAGIPQDMEAAAPAADMVAAWDSAFSASEPDLAADGSAPALAPEGPAMDFAPEGPAMDFAPEMPAIDLMPEMPELDLAPEAPATEPVPEGYEFDVAVIGGGPAGYVAAIRAAQLGGRAVLFEKDTVGGTCLNRGCVPTKTYVKTAEYIGHIRRASERGIVNDPNVSVDMPRVVDYKDSVVSKLTGGVEYLLKSYGVTVVKGEAAAKGAHEVECLGRLYTTAALILCGGSAPGRPPIPGIGHKAVLTSDEILDFAIVPHDLVILGGGVIGCEIACAWAAFGAKVTIVEMLPSLIANMGRKAAKAIEASLRASGVDVYTDTMVTAIEDEDGKPVAVTGDMRVKADVVLVATGRDADLSCLGALAGQAETERGKIVVNDRMETSIPGVYAAGDVTGGMMLAHTAFKMAETAAENALGGDKACDLGVVPAGVYTMPEAACVGLDEDAAREKAGDRLAVGYFPLSANGRSLASGEPEGFVQVMVDTEYMEILGVCIVGADAVEMIAEPAALMAIEATADEVADGIVHAHPTYSEAFMEACADALGRCVHLPKKK